MKISEIIKNYINKEGKPRIPGRYFSSELYGIINGETKPEDFFKKREIDGMGSKYISEGIAIEDYLTKVFKEMNVEVECQVKKEIQITDEVVIVAKPDFHFGSFLVELKRPARIWEDIPIKWVYQLESYARAFGLPTYLWQVYYPCSIKQLAYMPSNARWKKIKRILCEYHEGVKKIDLESKKL